MDIRKSFGKTKNYELFEDTFGLWLEVTNGNIELEYNGNHRVRMDIQSLDRDDLLTLIQSLQTYLNES